MQNLERLNGEAQQHVGSKQTGLKQLDLFENELSEFFEKKFILAHLVQEIWIILRGNRNSTVGSGISY